MEDQTIVFAYWKDNEFKGFRADTFNTISQTQPKIYTYSRQQVDTVIVNIREGCSRMGTSFAKILAGKNLVSSEGNAIDGDELVSHLSKTEQTFRDWNEFEVRVHPFVSREEFYSLGEGDEWKKDKILKELEPAIEVHKFKIVENEN